MVLTGRIVGVVRRESARFWTSDWTDRRVRVQRLYAPKLLSVLSLPIRIVLAVLLIAVLTALKPFVHIRFGRLQGFTMGLFSIPTEVYLCEVDAGMHPRKAFDIFYHHEPDHYHRTTIKIRSPKDSVCNLQLDKIFKRNLRVHETARY